MTVTPAARLRAAPSTLTRVLEGELVLLNLDTEAYFGLDDVGTRVWQALCDAPTVAAAVDALVDEYDVERAELEHDVVELATTLVARGLLVVE